MTGDLLEKHAESGSPLTVRLLPVDSGDKNSYVLLEGDAEALRFLGELLIAHAGQKADCGLQLHPGGPGSLHFDSGSNLGIYLHRIPCTSTDLDSGIPH